jgi:DNA repair exonuclease SbcCD ATPase subunit
VLQVLVQQLKQSESSGAALAAQLQVAQQTAAEDQLTHQRQAAQQEAQVQQLKGQLEDAKADVKRARMDAASMMKQYQQALNRLRREADAGEHKLVVATASWSKYKLTLTLMLKSEAAKTVIAWVCATAVTRSNAAPCRTCSSMQCPMP